MNKKLERLVKFAQKMQDVREGRCLHFSFILKGNKILCWSINRYKPHLQHRFGVYYSTKNNDDYKPLRHSECEVVKTYMNKYHSSDVSGLSLYNVRIDKNGKPLCAKPCKNCQRTIVDALAWNKVVWT